MKIKDKPVPKYPHGLTEAQQEQLESVAGCPCTMCRLFPAREVK